MENTQNNEQGQGAVQEQKQSGGQKNTGMAILAYILFFVPLLTEAKDDPFVKYHVRQGFILFVAWVLVYIVLQVLFGSIISFSMLGMYALLSNIVMLGFLVLVVMGIIHASKGEEKPLPLIGHFAEHVTFI